MPWTPIRREYQGTPQDSGLCFEVPHVSPAGLVDILSPALPASVTPRTKQSEDQVRYSTELNKLAAQSPAKVTDFVSAANAKSQACQSLISDLFTLSHQC